MNVLRKNRTISYGAIHAINSTSPLYLQPFGVVQLTVSAAGADTDIRLNAVPGTLQLELERCRETSRETLRGTSRETINLQCPDASTQQESALEQPTSQSRRRPPIQQLLWRHKTAPKRTHLRRTQPLTFNRAASPPHHRHGSQRTGTVRTHHPPHPGTVGHPLDHPVA